MIESEEKRKKLQEKIERWAKHTKVDQLLRDHDIPGLVQNILEEFYHIHACCGHMVKEQNEMHDFTHKEWWSDFDGSGWSDVSGCYCKDCYDWMIKQYDDKGFPIDEEEEFADQEKTI